MFNIITIGGSTRDFFFVVGQDKLKVIKTPKDLTAQEKIMFEFGAKIAPEKTHFSFGGGATNSAVSMSRLGLKVSCYTRSGRQEDCGVIRGNLRTEMVDTRYLVCDTELQAGISFILIAEDKSLEHTVFAYRGANENLQINPTRKYPTKWFYLTSLSGNWQKQLNNVYQIVTKQKIKLAWNPGGSQISAGHSKLKKILKVTEVFNVNKDEAIELALTAGRDKKQINSIDYLLKTIASWGPQTVVITDGLKGAYCYHQGKKYKQARYAMKRVDTTGAGDAFGSSFVAGLIKYKYDIRKALKLAAVNSSHVVAQYGTQAGLLTKKRLKRFGL